MQGKALIIVNPIAGHGKTKKILPSVQRKLTNHGVPFDIVETAGPGHACELAENASQNGYDVLAAMGGDGTVSEVVNGLMKAREAGAKAAVTIAVIPSGTGNDFSMGSRLFADWEEAVDAIIHPKVRLMDVFEFSDSGRLNRYAVNSVGIGYDAYVVKRVMQISTRKMGYLTYMIEAFRGLFEFNPGSVSVSFDGDRAVDYDRTWIVAITNSEKFGGGMTVCPGALPDDGLLDAAFLHGVPRKNLPGLIFLVRQGRHVGKQGVVRRAAAQIEVNAPPGFPCHIDGDTVDVEFPITVKILHQALPFIGKR